jgi:hypothetical protein
MSKRVWQLAREKEDLIRQCADERMEVADAFDEVRSSLTLSGALHGLGKVLRAHPMLTAGISSLLASGYAGTLTRSGSSILSVLRLARPIWSWWSTRRDSKNRPTT